MSANKMKHSLRVTLFVHLYTEHLFRKEAPNWFHKITNKENGHNCRNQYS